MKGLPKWINTKTDMKNLLDMYPDEARQRLRLLLESRFVWQTIGPADGDGVTDATRRVIEEDIDGAAVKLQQELVEDPNCHLFRLGYTVAEAEGLVVG